MEFEKFEELNDKYSGYGLYTMGIISSILLNIESDAQESVDNTHRRALFNAIQEETDICDMCDWIGEEICNYENMISKRVMEKLNIPYDKEMFYSEYE